MIENNGGEGSPPKKTPDDNNKDDKPKEIGAVFRFNRPIFDGDAEIWFYQLEAEFAVCKVSTEDKFRLAVASLPTSVIRKCAADLVKNPPRYNAYMEFKSAVLAFYAISDETRLEKFLHNNSQDIKKPSELYRSLLDTAGNLASADLIRRVWLNRLNDDIKFQLIGREKEELTEILKLADRLYESRTKSSQICETTSSSSDLMNERIGNLEKQISAFMSRYDQQISDRHHPRARTPSHSRDFRHRSATPSRSRHVVTEDGKCWYHRKFGDQAKFCRLPCTVGKINLN